MSSNNEKKTVGLPMALFTFVVVAVIMSVGNGSEWQVDWNSRRCLRSAARNEEAAGRRRDFLFRDE